MRRACSFIGLVLALAACGAASGRVTDSGIAGRVVSSPTCPVEMVPPQPQCAPRPLAATLLVRRVGRTARAIAVHSGADGRFRLALSPGRYLVTALPRGGSPFPRPPSSVTATVRLHRFTAVTVTYDTGIR
ncbi:MAG TPA: hypothetical protein VG388_13270 [Solirubrobacteraceae bacterium]|nr:hypothetical protein [Solirubrobacteraceae bacterium]